MGKISSKLVELEEKGIIEWNDNLNYYYLSSGSPSIPFDLNEYLRTRVLTTRSSTPNPIFAMPYGK